MIKLVIILLFIQAEQWQLYTDGHRKEGVMAVHQNILYVKFDGYAASSFEIINRENDAHFTYYYIKNQECSGSVVIKQDRVIFNLFIGKHHFFKTSYLKIYKS